MAENAADTNYFTNGAAYDRLARRITRDVGGIFIDWLSLPKGLNWIDVGCGTGAFTQLLLDRCAPGHVSAVDPSTEQIAFARTIPAAKRVDFQTGDALALPFGNGQFDAGAMALVITFVPDADKAVTELKRVTKPGGTIGAYMWDFYNGGSPRDRLNKAVEQMGIAVPPLPGHAHSRMEAMQGYFKSAGLADVASRVMEIDVTYADFDEYWTAQTGVVNFVVKQIHQMSATDVERLKANLRASLPLDKSGRISYKAKANAVKGHVPRH